MVVYASETRSVSAAEVNQDKTLWIRSAGTLLVGAIGTNLSLATFSEKVMNPVSDMSACGKTHCSLGEKPLSYREKHAMADICSAQILSLEHWHIAGLLFATDCIFVATSFKFLQQAEDFDRDWHKSRKRYPGT